MRARLALYTALLASACDDVATTRDAAPVDVTGVDRAAPDASVTDVSPLDTSAPDVVSLDVTALDAPSDVARGDASVNPLGLTPGVAVTRPLGPLARPGDVDLRTAAVDLDLAIDLGAQAYAVRLPARFDPSDPSRRYALISYIDAGDAHAVPASWTSTLDARDVIWLGAQGVGNGQSVAHRMGAALLGALRMMELYPIDPARVYVSGLSGGSRSASALGYLRTDVFRGFIGRVGAAMPAVIPGWQTAGTSASDLDADYEVMISSTRPPVTLPVWFRTALMTQYGDFRRAENVAIYRYGHLNHGNCARLVMRPGGHADEIADSFSDALAFVDDPGVDLTWDRFEDGDLARNADPGRTVAGAGFVVRAGAAREERVTYDGASLGVLRLVGDGATVEARETFSWRDAVGVTLDARLRAETMTGANQRVALHVVPAGDAAPDAQPGLHVTWGYGEPSRAELVGADGARHTLATWTYAGPHPMALATTVMSPQSGEGVVPEKTFWNAAAAPDFAGATRRFRGEDLRLVLNASGFQLTFVRPVSGLVTSYTGRVVAQSSSDGEELPVVIQGFWREVEPSVVSALPSGRWRAVFTNRTAGGAGAVGDALLDEVRVVGAGATPAAPPTLRAVTASGRTTLTWAGVLGARGYRVERAATAGGAFTTAATAPAHVTTWATTDAGVWRVLALGDGAASAPSPTAP